jgi:methylmalonyl-CoA/ethylmalonyl-CoA epimerase
MSEQRLGTTTVTQIGVVVMDIEATAAAWAAILGLSMPTVQITDALETAGTEYHGQRTGARAKLAFFHLGQVDLELIEPLGDPSTWQEALDAHGDSLHHIAFEVKGMGKSLAYLAANGLPLIQRGEYEGGRYAYVDGTAKLGAVLELLEND